MCPEVFLNNFQLTNQQKYLRTQLCIFGPEAHEIIARKPHILF